MVAPAAECRVGTSGFHYDHWKKIFYPERLPKKRWFEHYASHFDTLEVNNTFYRVPPKETFLAWREQTPPGFVYALKFSRFASHNKKLLTPEQTLGYFYERADPLLSRVRPILLQLPPRWKVNAKRLDEFLAAAPRRHGWAVEMRDASWLSDEVYRVLERHSAALCIHDILPHHPRVLTADWTYVRFHGFTARSRYGGNYTDGQLGAWAGQIRKWLRDGVDVYAYFNNDLGGHAVRNALKLRELLGLAGPAEAGAVRNRSRAAASGGFRQRKSQATSAAHPHR